MLYIISFFTELCYNPDNDFMEVFIMSVQKTTFGYTADSQAVSEWTITNVCGSEARILDYGATLRTLSVPNAHGSFTDVVLGYDSVTSYETFAKYLGATVGRVGNRIGGARFSLNGTEYTLVKNNGENNLHGGIKGFSFFVWNAEQVSENAVRFSRLSPDGEEGFPGNLNVSVTYTLTNDNALKISYEAVSDADTLVNLTNHSYFDLSGCGKAMEQIVTINAEYILENDNATLPTGKKLPVAGTAFDFRQPKPVGRDIDNDEAQLRFCAGYDHNYCLCSSHGASVVSKESGIKMDMYTDLPGVQFYSANWLENTPGKNGTTHHRRGAVCLETQLYPNAMNCWSFPSPVLRAGVKMKTETVYAFSLV